MPRKPVPPKRSAKVRVKKASALSDQTELPLDSAVVADRVSSREVAEAIRFLKADPGIMDASLFRPIQKGSKTRLEASSKHKGYELTFVGSYQLGPFDQDVFMACLYIASSRHPYKTVYPDTERKFLLDLLTPPASTDTGEVSVGFEGERRKLYAWTSLGEIMRELGKDDSGENRTLLKASLRRLGFVVVEVKSPDGRVGNNLLLRYIRAPDEGKPEDEKDSTVYIMLHSRLTEAIVGVEGGDAQHVRINFQDRMKLKQPVARIVHAWLCARVRVGGDWTLGLDALVAHVYGGVAASERTMRERRKVVREALTELFSLKTWSQSEWAGDAKMEIRRSATDAVFSKKY